MSRLPGCGVFHLRVHADLLDPRYGVSGAVFPLDLCRALDREDIATKAPAVASTPPDVAHNGLIAANGGLNWNLAR